MPTDCNLALCEFPSVEERRVVASFDGESQHSTSGAGRSQPILFIA